jgi:predicted acyltransferase
MDTLTATPLTSTVTQKATRFLSLDVFRGMTVAGMILVNTPGSWEFVYSPLRHAPWDGCTPTDLVFPFFLFAVGNALSFAIVKYEKAGDREVLKKIFIRSALIFAIGLFLNWFPFIRWQEGELVFRKLENLRIFGVLQRIALAYLGGALIVHYFKGIKAFVVGCGLLLLYCMILLIFGDLTLEGNAVLKLDTWLLGESHMYKGYVSTISNQNIPFDPEGLLSAIPAMASVVFGFLVGRFIKEKGNSYEMISHLFAVGIILIFAGLCWSFYFPINKPIWSSSYVLYTTGLATTILAVILFIVEMKNFREWTKPFVLFGKNPLLIFALSGIIVKFYILIRINNANAYTGLFKNVFQPVFGDYVGSLSFAIFHVLLFLLVAWILERRKIYLRV